MQLGSYFLKVFTRLRRIFEPKEEENGEWRRFQNEKLHSLFYLPKVIKSKRLRWACYIARMEEGMATFKTSEYKPTEKRP